MAGRITANFAANFAPEQSREVFAVPGNPLDPRAAGTNRLIKEGATLTISAEDILEVIGPMLETPIALCASKQDPALVDDPSPPPPVEIHQNHRLVVLEALGPAPISIDDLARATGLEARYVRGVLLELALAGRIEYSAGRQRVALVGGR
jgi:DNA processing protein